MKSPTPEKHVKFGWGTGADFWPDTLGRGGSSVWPPRAKYLTWWHGHHWRQMMGNESKWRHWTRTQTPLERGEDWAEVVTWAEKGAYVFMGVVHAGEELLNANLLECKSKGVDGLCRVKQSFAARGFRDAPEGAVAEVGIRVRGAFYPLLTRVKGVDAVWRPNRLPAARPVLPYFLAPRHQERDASQAKPPRPKVVKAKVETVKTEVKEVAVRPRGVVVTPCMGAVREVDLPPGMETWKATKCWDDSVRARGAKWLERYQLHGVLA
jgi:hypothetical protein